MSGFPIVDLVVGIIFLFFLISIICSSVVEMIMTARRVRAEVLGQWMLRIFDTDIPKPNGGTVKLGQAIMDHCATTALVPEGKPPSYMDARNFVSALLDKVAKCSTVTKPETLDDFITSFKTSTAISEELKRTFILQAIEARDSFAALSNKTTGAIELFRNRIENWYDSNMVRISGTMKVKYTRRFTLISAIIITLLLNADTVAISKYLYNNPEARAQLAAKAYETAADDSIRSKMELVKERNTKDDTTRITLKQLDSTLNVKRNDINTAYAAVKTSIPIGWSVAEFKPLKDGWDWAAFIISKIVGLTIMVFAILLGAPFWFDVLNKISNLRGVGKRPDTSPSDKASN
jgi:hypothetical protein